MGNLGGSPRLCRRCPSGTFDRWYSRAQPNFCRCFFTPRYPESEVLDTLALDSAGVTTRRFALRLCNFLPLMLVGGKAVGFGKSKNPTLQSLHLPLIPHLGIAMTPDRDMTGKQSQRILSIEKDVHILITALRLNHFYCHYLLHSGRSKGWWTVEVFGFDGEESLVDW